MPIKITLLTGTDTSSNSDSVSETLVVDVHPVGELEGTAERDGDIEGFVDGTDEGAGDPVGITDTLGETEGAGDPVGITDSLGETEGE